MSADLFGFAFPFVFFGVIMGISICMCECMEKYFATVCHFWQLSARTLKSSALLRQKRGTQTASLLNRLSESSRPATTSDDNGTRKKPAPTPTPGTQPTTAVSRDEDEIYDPPPSYFSNVTGIGGNSATAKLD